MNLKVGNFVRSFVYAGDGMTIFTHMSHVNTWKMRPVSFSPGICSMCAEEYNNVTTVMSPMPPVVVSSGTLPAEWQSWKVIHKGYMCSQLINSEQNWKRRRESDASDNEKLYCKWEYEFTYVVTSDALNRYIEIIVDSGITYSHRHRHRLLYSDISAYYHF